MIPVLSSPARCTHGPLVSVTLEREVEPPARSQEKHRCAGSALKGPFKQAHEYKPCPVWVVIRRGRGTGGVTMALLSSQ